MYVRVDYTHMHQNVNRDAVGESDDTWLHIWTVSIVQNRFHNIFAVLFSLVKFAVALNIWFPPRLYQYR